MEKARRAGSDRAGVAQIQERRQWALGTAKDRLMAEWGQGWKFVDDEFACDECVEEPFLKGWVSRNANGQACSYCGRNSPRTPLAVTVNDLFAFIDEGLRTEYDEALEWYPYDSEEKTLVGTKSDSYELADDLELFSNERLRERFVHGFENRMFCPRDPYSQSESEAFDSGWRRFVDHVKHRTRYYFLTDPSAQDLGDEWSRCELSINQTPSYLGEAIREIGLVRRLETGAPLFRARISRAGAPYRNAQQLGTAPTAAATAANRMSPAGIAIFYGAADERTAIAEVSEEAWDQSLSAAASVGAFKPSRPLHLIDLTGQVELPSMFDGSARHLREKVRLLNGFARDIAEPIQRDEKEHIEYVPTQIVTEYFRHVFAVEEGVPIDGIMYQSSRRPGGVCYVVFVDNKHCVDDGKGPDDALYLLLPPDAVQIFGPHLGPR